MSHDGYHLVNQVLLKSRHKIKTGMSLMFFKLKTHA